jgi:hypothetical protein
MVRRGDPLTAGLLASGRRRPSGQSDSHHSSGTATVADISAEVLALASVAVYVIV